jgi:hypothetical protein
MWLDPDIRTEDSIYYSWNICYSCIAGAQLLDFFVIIRARFMVEKKDFDKTMEIRAIEKKMRTMEEDSEEK